MQNAGQRWLILCWCLFLSACVAEDEGLLNSEWAIFYGLDRRPLAFGQEYNVNNTVVRFDSILISSGNDIFLPAPAGEGNRNGTVRIRIPPNGSGRLQPLTCRLQLHADDNRDGQAGTPVTLEFQAGPELRRLIKTTGPKKSRSSPQIEVDLIRLLTGIDWQQAADTTSQARQAVRRQLEKNLPQAIRWKADGS